jgi:hypothetical protein
MVTVGVLAKFEFKPGNEAAVERFFRQGQLVVEGQPETSSGSPTASDRPPTESRHDSL